MRFNADDTLNGLRPFQRQTVEHVTDRFYGSDPTRNFLVADETGLGKSLIARGVIATTIEHLQDEESVDRIDVIYVCSNADIARQNLKRLDVIGGRQEMTTRLSLLATRSRQLQGSVGAALKPVNLVSLTPKTSFEKGWRTGQVDERALLMLILEDELGLSGARRTAAYRILQGGVGTWKRFQDHCRSFAQENRDDLDRDIVDRFVKEIRRPLDGQPSLLDRFECLVEDTTGHSQIRCDDPQEPSRLVGEMRAALAHSGVDTLEPDLIILDEFQRFTDLLDEGSEQGQLAHALFGYANARVLLLSATPFKAFTGPESEDGINGHHEQFMQTVGFLSSGRQSDTAFHLETLLTRFREQLIGGTDPSETVQALEHSLTRIMCRTERPASEAESMVVESAYPVATVDAPELTQFVHLQRLAVALDTHVNIDYWKSIPHLPYFMHDYQIGRKLREALRGPDDVDIRPMVESFDRISSRTVSQFAAIPAGNGRMQSLMDSTTGKGLQEFLWVAPSLPYLRPAGPFAGPTATDMTKKLVFSSWSGAPSSVAALLSYEANRRIAVGQHRAVRNTSDALRNVSQRLQFSIDRGRQPRMTTLAIFAPMPALAAMADPLTFAGSGEPTDTEQAESEVARLLRQRLPLGSSETGASDAARLHWEWPLSLDDSALDSACEELRPEGIARALRGKTEQDEVESDETTSIDLYVQMLLEARGAAPSLAYAPGDLTEITAKIAMHSPANCAWRALGRLPVDCREVTNAGRWGAAAVLAAGLRSTFNRWEAALLLDHLYGDELPYWQRVLRYCADGNLQAVLDEYLFHLVAVEGDHAFDDESITDFAHTAAEALKLKPGSVKARDPLGEDDLEFSTRFAMRFGDSRSDEVSARPSEIRHAFNSPFWPFVLVSTSVGQEGVDFHPWCHNLVHWNVPTNPVDFEQRDGRVNRFRGHALRKNIASSHSASMLASTNPWNTGYELASQDGSCSEIDGLAPDWVYPGPARVVREVMPYQLSVDQTRLKRIKSDVARYRLAFGQPRQEDLMEILESQGITDEQAQRLRLDLRPPRQDSQ